MAREFGVKFPRPDVPADFRSSKSVSLILDKNMFPRQILYFQQVEDPM